MKINNEKLKGLASLDDEALWQQMLTIAGGKGHKINSPMPPHEEMERIRRIMRGEEKISLGEAMKILNTYKNGGAR